LCVLKILTWKDEGLRGGGKGRLCRKGKKKEKRVFLVLGGSTRKEKGDSPRNGGRKGWDLNFTGGVKPTFFPPEKVFSGIPVSKSDSIFLRELKGRRKEKKKLVVKVL